MDTVSPKSAMLLRVFGEDSWIREVTASSVSRADEVDTEFTFRLGRAGRRLSADKQDR